MDQIKYRRIIMAIQDLIDRTVEEYSPKVTHYERCLREDSRKLRKTRLQAGDRTDSTE